MPRSNRYILPGLLYHVTHRCHNRQFLFRAAVDRSEYRLRLSDALDRFDVSLLSYSITSNHTHMILTALQDESISRMMHSLEGKFGEYYNARKSRSGAFWEDRFHSTMIEEGPHLLNCMVYIDLNMVRAGAVCHPKEWDWCGYRELVGMRQRNRIIDHGLLRQLVAPFSDDFESVYADEIERAVTTRRLAREALWTESIAVGSREYVSGIEKQTKPKKKRVKIEQAGDGRWCVREEPEDYRIIPSADFP